MQLFKYCRQEHMEKFFTDGSLRIGTLYDYRSEEDHGIEIGDHKEGALVFSGTGENLTKQQLAEMPLLRGIIDAPDGGTIGRVTFTDCIIDRGDLYIFSTSQDYSRGAHLQWAEDPTAQYNACYSINSARLFFREVSRAISKKAKFLGFGQVHYYDSDQGLDIRSPLGHLHPGQLKGGKRYSQQMEIRAYWQPLSALSPPFLTKVPEAIKYCTRLASALPAGRVGA